MVASPRYDRDVLSDVMSGGGNVENVNFVGKKGIARLGMDALLKLGQKQLLEGASRDEVLRNTRMFADRGIYGQAPSMQWKTEIPGHTATIKEPFKKMLESEFNNRYWGTHDAPLGEMMDYPDLYKAYPDLANLPASTTIKPHGRVTAGYQKAYEPSTLGGLPVGMTGPSVITSNITSPEQLRELLLHEIQHAIQWREGFPSGASIHDDPRRLQEVYDKMRAKAQTRLGEMQQEMQDAYTPDITADEYSRFLLDPVRQKEQSGYASLVNPPKLMRQQAPTDLGYMLHAGETEARNAAWRGTYLNNPEDLLKQQPWLTQDYPSDIQWRVKR